MTEKLYIQLSDDTHDDLFDAAEHISWRLPNETVRFITREVIMSAHELSQIPEAELTDNQAYLLEILNDLLKQSGAAYRYILQPAAKPENRSCLRSCENCQDAHKCKEYNFDSPRQEAASCPLFTPIQKGDKQ